MDENSKPNRMKYQVLAQGGDPDNNPIFDVHITNKLIREFANQGVSLTDYRPRDVPELGIKLIEFYTLPDDDIPLRRLT